MADMHEPTPRELGKLREFSTRLAERLKAAPSAPAEAMRLAVRIGRRGYLVDMSLASEIVALPGVTPVPWTRPWYRGLINVRGRLVGVVDLEQFGGGAALVPEDSQQALVFGEGLGVNAALVITRAFGLRALASLQSVEPAAQARPWELTRYLDADGGLLTELDLRALAADPGFAAIGV
jgi:twitching motility protein PilI